MYSNVVEEVKNKIGAWENILDIGCGTGSLLINILEKIETYTIGLDISRAMIKKAAKNISKHEKKKHVDLVLGDAHKLPFRNNSLNLIISTGTLHHIRNPEELFKECKRTLKQNREAWIYELSHDIKPEEFKETLKQWKKPRKLLKLAALTHGIPRKEYEKGYIKKALNKTTCNYEVKYRNIITKLIIRKTNTKHRSVISTLKLKIIHKQ